MTEKIIECYNLSAELKLMLSLALWEDLPVIPENIDWKKFDSLVSKNRIEPLVAEGIRRLPFDMVIGNEVLEKLLESKNHYALLSMLQMQTLAALVKDFSNHNIRALSLKGPILAMELYGNPALRYSRDLDILVSEADLEEACKRLESLGYKEEVDIQRKTPLRRKKMEKKGEEMHRVYTMENICIELHWRLSFRIDETFGDLWERSRTKVIMGQKIHYLGECDNISYLICHAAGHGYHRLRWLLDIYELKKSEDIVSIAYQFMKKQNAEVFMLETILVLYLLPCFALPHYENNDFDIKRENNMVTVRCEKTIKKDFLKAYKLAMAAYPIVVNSAEQNGIAGRKYNYLLPTLGSRNILNSIGEIFEPCKADLELIDLPDCLYFLYYIIRPFYKLWRMVMRSRKQQ